jgi:hypothetical protein
LNSSKITSSMREPVSTSAVPMIVMLPPPLCGAMERAEPKNALGVAIACASSPPDSVRPIPLVALNARAMRVIESSTITTSRPSSARRCARCITVCTTSRWRSAGMSNELATTSP